MCCRGQENISTLKFSTQREQNSSEEEKVWNAQNPERRITQPSLEKKEKMEQAKTIVGLSRIIFSPYKKSIEPIILV